MGHGVVDTKEQKQEKRKSAHILLILCLQLFVYLSATCLVGLIYMVISSK